MDFNTFDLLKAIFASFWTFKDLYIPLFGFFFLILAFELLRDLISRRSKIKFLLSKRKIRELQQLKPSDFEEYIAALFNKLGYTTRVIGGRGDGGVDVEARKDDVVHYIQCKKFITSKVPVGAVRDFYGSIADRIDGGKGYFITTNVFTLDAERFAEDKPIELIDKFALIKYINSVNIEIPKPNTNREVNTSCPRCEGVLVPRIANRGDHAGQQFLGCSNFPKCHYTQDIE